MRPRTSALSNRSRRDARALRVGSRTIAAVVAVLAFCTAGAAASPLQAQAPLPPPTKEEIGRAVMMIEQLSGDLKKYYYDSTFHGIDLEAKKRQTIERIKAAQSQPQAFAYVAQFLADFNDSHTFLQGFEHKKEVSYGYSLKLVGDSCYVSRVTKGSDAEAKGLARGDRLVKLDGNVPTRQNLWVLQYVYRALSPRAAVHLVVEHPTGITEEMDVLAKITEGRVVRDYTDDTERHFMEDEGEKEMYRLRHRYHEYGDSIIVWRFPEFVGGDQDGIDNMMALVKRHRALVLDLRGNPGGSVATQLRLIGSFFDSAVVNSKWRTRDSTFTLKADPVSKNPFRGMLVILIDGQSASASEMTARTMQLEGRAIIVGDRSAGAVQTARTFPHAAGYEKFLAYAASITIADVEMSDGSRLERVGVVPDEIVLPTGADMATGRDPQMARALAIVGMTVTPEQAARVFREDKDAGQ